jgi:UbiA prenyltransferase family
MTQGGLGVYLRLGRVSNLPTVWSNVVAGALLAGAAARPATLLVLALALSAFYVGGMYLNDGFDRHIDARERPERPIPAGLISARRVFAIGFGLLALGLVGVAGVSLRPAPIFAGVALGGTIVLYDAWHKANPLSPVIMGMCRVLVYVTAALAATGNLPKPLLLSAACLLAYLIGLTYVAKHENKPLLARLWPLAGLAAPLVYAAASLRSPLVAAVAGLFLAWIVRALVLLRSKAPKRIPRAVTSLIAGISLVDALLLARAGASVTVVALVATGWLLTLLFQRFVPGT